MISKVGKLVDLQVQLWILVSQTASRQSHGSQEEEKGVKKKVSSTYVKMHNMLTDQYKLDECGKMHLLTW